MGHLELEDLLCVNLLVFDCHTRGRVDDHDATLLGCSNDCLVKGTPAGVSELMLVGCCDLLDRFWSVFSCAACQDLCHVEDANLADLLLEVDQEELLVTEAELDLDFSVAWGDEVGNT